MSICYITVKKAGSATWLREIYFDETFNEVEILIEENTVISSIVLGNAVTVQYSIDGGIIWNTLTISTTLNVGLVRLRVSDFGVYSDGTIIIKGY